MEQLRARRRRRLIQQNGLPPSLSELGFWGVIVWNSHAPLAGRFARDGANDSEQCRETTIRSHRNGCSNLHAALLHQWTTASSIFLGRGRHSFGSASIQSTMQTSLSCQGASDRKFLK